MPYAIKHEDSTYTPDGKANINDVDQYNKEVEAQELAHWATAPDRWQVYITKQEDNRYVATTWLGTALGVAPVQYRKFRTNISRNMVAIHFKGTNGATYYGQYGADWTQLCRVRKAK